MQHTCSPVYHLWVLRVAVQGYGRAISIALNLCVPTFSVLTHALYTGIPITQWESYMQMESQESPQLHFNFPTILTIQNF
jgi:hypothetical protein